MRDRRSVDAVLRVGALALCGRRDVVQHSYPGSMH